MPNRNRLGEEKSPYLLQHRDNPVHWYAWGEAAFAAARAGHKPIFLSIGYSTCHWCHVMAHDSFEDQAVAEYLNQHFISIKVDREERPDIDQVYMDAVVALTGQGGWPLSVFLTPDRVPFFGGTFFWRAQFLELVERLHGAWDRVPDQVAAQGKLLLEALQRETATSGVATGVPLREVLFPRAVTELARRFDADAGGFGGAPKFPPSQAIRLLLRAADGDADGEVLRMATTTLDHMARGGIYDHVGGGFHRYATDAEWLVPHFEKMLYDNALLAVAYLEAYQVTRHEQYAAVARETLDYVLREMQHPEGGLYSAQDADSEGIEGKFYVWTEAELRAALRAEEFARVAAVYQATARGNFVLQREGEGAGKLSNILHLDPRTPWEVHDEPLLRSARQKLLQRRAQRVPPHLDDKILAGWNGLMLGAMAKGFQVLEDVRYLHAAQTAARFLRDRLFVDGRLLRRYRDGEARFTAVLEDYAYLIDGLLQLYQSDFDPTWLEWARALQMRQDEDFWDEARGGYFYSARNADDVLVRSKEWHDGALPAANGVAAHNLLRLFSLTMELPYRERAMQLFTTVRGLLERAPSAFAATLLAVDAAGDRARELAIIGDPSAPAVAELLSHLRQGFFPNLVVALAAPASAATRDVPLLRDRPQLDGLPTYYLCTGTICQAPTTVVDEITVGLNR